MAYLTLKNERSLTCRLRKDLVQSAAIRDFEYHIGHRLYNLPTKFVRPILHTQQAVFDRTTLICRYKLLTVTDILSSDTSAPEPALFAGMPDTKPADNVSTVMINDVYRLTGSFVGLKRGDKALFVIITLQGLGQIQEETKRLSEQYYLDIWGRVIIEQGISYFRHELRRALRRSGLSPTRFIYPGMRVFPLPNQAEIFRILDPADMGVTLSSSYIMTPDKSFTCVSFAIRE